MSSEPFISYPKTPRLRRNIIVTEKIDGTNAQVCITEYPTTPEFLKDPTIIASKGLGAPGELVIGSFLAMRVGSRTRWLTPGKGTDNFGFAAWCLENQEELFKLGVGRHFGEWYGQGIQRGYGLDHRRFALFNVSRWRDGANMPRCVETVPILFEGDWGGEERALDILRRAGSSAVVGYMNPEGINVFHSASGQNFKVLLENDEAPKGAHGPAPCRRW